MYIVQEKSHRRCSKCGAADQYEEVTKPSQSFGAGIFPQSSKNFIRCTKCGHEKVTSETTTSGSKNFLVYTARNTHSNTKEF